MSNIAFASSPPARARRFATSKFSVAASSSRPWTGRSNATHYKASRDAGADDRGFQARGTKTAPNSRAFCSAEVRTYGSRCCDLRSQFPHGPTASFKLSRDNGRRCALSPSPPSSKRSKASSRGRRLRVGDTVGFSVDDVVSAIEERRRREALALPDSGESLRTAEFKALVKGRPEAGPDDQFVCEEAENPTEFVARHFSSVMLVRRLLEVRALESFTRVMPPSPADPPEYRADMSAEQMPWLPAIEVRGEGVFVRLDESSLQLWEQRHDVRTRVKQIAERYVAMFEARGTQPDREITPRLVLVHSLAHALVNQWALDSGYPATALRERLFVGEDHAGILIYTATTDSAGSLGGVLAQAEPARLESSLREAMLRAAWCSSDPLCIETEAAGADSLNLAACHACLLLPEVSCEEMNVLLDRALLAGLPNARAVGFFED